MAENLEKILAHVCVWDGVCLTKKPDSIQEWPGSLQDRFLVFLTCLPLSQGATNAYNPWDALVFASFVNRPWAVTIYKQVLYLLKALTTLGVYARHRLRKPPSFLSFSLRTRSGKSNFVLAA